MVNVKEKKKEEERMMKDEVKEKIKGIKNSEIFIERMRRMMKMESGERKMKKKVLVIEIERLKKVNESIGM